MHSDREQKRFVKKPKEVNTNTVGEALHENAFRVNTDVDCMICGANPTVGDTELCGPCCFGDSDTIGGNW